MSRPEGRSVGELLLDSELVARGVLMDVDQMEGRAMLRTWGEVVQSAGELWQALPKTGRNPLGGDAREPDDAVMEQLQGIGRTLVRTRGELWPGDGPADPRLLRISGNLLTAGELLQRQREDVRPMRPQVREDLSAAKARIMHTLYVASHGVNLALGRDIRALENTMVARRAFAPGESLVRSRAARNRVAVFEQLTGAYVSRTYPGALDGEYAPTPIASRLGQALAAFDVQVHRTFSGEVTGADVMATARSQALIMLAGQVLLRAGAETGVIEPGGYKSRLFPSLEDAQSSWAGLASQWRTLTAPGDRRIDPDLSAAVDEARASLLDIIHDRATLASPNVLSGRVDLAATAGTIQDALSSAVDQAHLVEEVTRDQTLHGRARAVNTMTLEIADEWPEKPAGSVEQAWVSPRDLLSNRLVPLSGPVREAMHASAAATVQVATRAMSAAAFLDRTVQRETGPTHPGPSVGASRERATPPRLHPVHFAKQGPQK